jgi:polyhydroxyalkanoate synthesis regulator phasin
VKEQPRSVFDILRSKGSAIVAQVSEELMKNPAFIRALETAYRGKERLNIAVGHALKTMNVPTRSEFKRAVARIEALERELADRKDEPAAAAPAPKRRPARRKKAPPATGA